MKYCPIESYGVIGDLQSVALVSVNGSIDWCCLPRFDSPSVFGRILDAEKGGYFRISALQDGRLKQMYLPDTNVLLTRFLSADGVGEVADFMPVHEGSGGITPARTRQIIRIAKSVRRTVKFRLECFPAFDYARERHTIEQHEWGVRFRTPVAWLDLVTQIKLQVDGNGVFAEFELSPNQTATFALRYNDGDLQPVDGDKLLTETVRYWRSWLTHCKYTGRWREMVTRSALALKLLTYAPTGAIVAAATCSLPEEIGGERNWDYRYTWVRDAAFSVYALMRLGYTDEAGAFTRFMQACTVEEERVNGPLNVLYGIDGRHDVTEFTLDHFEGYCGSKPVRVGNAAAHHLQLDIYGELMDSVYLYDKYGSPLSYEMWLQVERMLDWVAQNWDRADRSIWEVRGPVQQFTYSKLQCWVALDRGLRLASKRSFPVGEHDWQAARDTIYRKIMTEGWNPQLRTFVQYFGADAVDASSLMFPLLLFVSPTDPRMESTIDAIRRELVSDSLVYRYDVGKAARDGLPGGEGTFSICTFWLVEALTRAGHIEEAQFLFEKMLTYANHLGLFGEQLSPGGQMLGNFPQAFTHLGLISAAYNLDKRLDNAKQTVMGAHATRD
jgi:GH15 family glucan-1,4-alpha-glucosidase